MMARPRYSREAKEMLGHLVRLCDAFGVSSGNI